MNYVSPPNQQLFYEQVWALVRQIPSGQVATYGQIAALLSQPDEVSDDDYRVSASRWVGLAMAVCPDDTPWQRVLNSQGMVSHPEAARQIRLLAEEGVYFSKNRIDLNQYQWLLSEQSDRPKQGQLF